MNKKRKKTRLKKRRKRRLKRVKMRFLTNWMKNSSL